MIENVHERRIAASAEAVGELLETWGSAVTASGAPTFRSPHGSTGG